MSSNEQLLKDFVEDIEDAQVTYNTLQGQKKELLNQLEREFGISEKELPKFYAKMKQELADAQTEFEDQFEDFKKEWEEDLE
jgi:deoxyribodipyrimidine photolyase